jgi:hypothetical protein
VPRQVDTNIHNGIYWDGILDGSLGRPRRKWNIWSLRSSSCTGETNGNSVGESSTSNIIGLVSLSVVVCQFVTVGFFRLIFYLFDCLIDCLFIFALNVLGIYGQEFS